jgi:hypothetical protein
VAAKSSKRVSTGKSPAPFAGRAFRHFTADIYSSLASSDSVRLEANERLLMFVQRANEPFFSDLEIFTFFLERVDELYETCEYKEFLKNHSAVLGSK